jgi:DNA-binding MarR family transcriptional regulator
VDVLETLHPLGESLDFLQRLWKLDHALERLSSNMERELGITGPQRFVIRCVGSFPGMTAGQLAQVMHLDPGTVSALLRRLETKKLVSRRRDPRDGRRVCLGLTAQGRRLNRPETRTAEHAVKRLLESAAPGDLARTKKVIAALTDLLAHEIESNSPS